MMMVLRKKQLVIAALAVVIGVAGYYNAGKNGSDAIESGQKYMGEAQLVNSADVAEESDFFTQARIDREAGRSRSIETFNALISNVITLFQIFFTTDLNFLRKTPCIFTPFMLK